MLLFLVIINHRFNNLLHAADNTTFVNLSGTVFATLGRRRIDWYTLTSVYYKTAYLLIFNCTVRLFV